MIVRRLVWNGGLAQRDASGENQTLQSPGKGARALADNGFRGSIC